MSQEQKSTLSGVAFPLKPYTIKDLSEIYGVSPKTFRKWMGPFKQDLGAKHGYYYTISQVKQIVSNLGVPGNTIVD